MSKSIVPEEEEVQNTQFSADELLQKMGQAAWEYRKASMEMKKFERKRLKWREKLRVILMAKRIDLIQNEKLKDHLEMIFEEPRWRITKDDIEAMISVELDDSYEDLETNYVYYEKQAKTAEAEHNMWSRQLSWHQSKVKLQAAELASLGG